MLYFSTKYTYQEDFVKLKTYESPALYLLELYAADVISSSSGTSGGGSGEEKTEDGFGPIDGGAL